MPASTRRVFLSGALALSVGPAHAATAPLRVVASSIPHAEILEFVGEKLAPELPLKTIEISGDLRPNAMLRDGDADANFSQHVPFLRSAEAAMGMRFAIVAAVHIEPLRLYSRRAKSLVDLPTGDVVSLSNSVSNTSRGLALLQANGLIRLRATQVGVNATLDDIIENPKNFRFVKIAPPQLPRSLDDVALAVTRSGSTAVRSSDRQISARFAPSRRAEHTAGSRRPLMSTLFKPVQVGAFALDHRVILARLTRMRSKRPGNVPGEARIL